jgi:hypothetical protein
VADADEDLEHAERGHDLGRGRHERDHAHGYFFFPLWLRI